MYIKYTGVYVNNIAHVASAYAHIHKVGLGLSSSSYLAKIENT